MSIYVLAAIASSFTADVPVGFVIPNNSMPRITLAPNAFRFSTKMLDAQEMPSEALPLLTMMQTAPSAATQTYSQIHKKLSTHLLQVPTWADSLNAAHPHVVRAHRALNATGRSGKLLIIFPFREHAFGKFKTAADGQKVGMRTRQVLETIFAINSHLAKLGKLPNRDYSFLIMEQANYDVTFNKGSVVNSGAHLARLWGYDYFAMNDADFAPGSLENGYDLPPDGLPVHMSSSPSEPDTYLNDGNQFGGAFAISVADYFRTNGMSNIFWGWGYEDDLFRTSIGRQTGFHRLNGTAGYYVVEKHKNEVNRNSDLLSRNNKHRFYSYWTGRAPTRFEDGVNELNVTLTRYAPIASLPGVHWATASLETMRYRPNKSGWESAELQRLRRGGALPPLSEIGLREDHSFHIDPLISSHDLQLIEDFRLWAVQSFIRNNVTHFPRTVDYLG
jgi:hypothetical protein